MTHRYKQHSNYEASIDPERCAAAVHDSGRMEGIRYIEKIREYCCYIERHLRNVEASWVTLQRKCKDMRFIYDDYVFVSIDEEVKAHDLSKFSVEEFIPYQRKFYPVGEPEELGLAWVHHQECNPHHWQHWTAKEYGNPYAAEVHCVCMVIDWMAMGLEFGDTAEEYYEREKEKIDLPDWAVTFIGEIFERLR